MRKSVIAFTLLLAFTASAEWVGLTDDRHVCGPKLTAESLKGKVVLVDMWATWCGPCRAMMPHTEEIAKKFRGTSLVVIGSHVPRGFDKAKVQAYAKENKFTFSFYEGVKWSDDIGFDGGIPFLYVVDKKGTVVYHGRDAAAVEQAIEQAIGKAGGGSFIADEELVAYKSLKGRIMPGKPVEQMLKRLESDVKFAEENPSSATFAVRKAEATKILAAVEAYKKDLLDSIEAELRANDESAAREHIRILTATWPSLKDEWAAKLKALDK